MKNPVFNFDLNPNQADFYDCDEQVIAFFGGIGNGKTYAGILKGIMRIMNPDNPPQLGMIARQTYPELRDSTQRTFFEICHLMGLLPEETRSLVLLTIVSISLSFVGLRFFISSINLV